MSGSEPVSKEEGAALASGNAHVQPSSSRGKKRRLRLPRFNLPRFALFQSGRFSPKVLKDNGLPRRLKRASRDEVHRKIGTLTFSRLTLIIVMANLIGLVILLLGSFGMTQYRDGLVAAKLEGVRAQSQVIADIIAQVAADDSACERVEIDETGNSTGCRVSLRDDDLSVMFSKVWDSFEGRVRVYNAPDDFDNIAIPDARVLLLEDVVLRRDEFDTFSLPAIDEEEQSFSFDRLWLDMEDFFLTRWPDNEFQNTARRRTLEQELISAFSLSPTAEQRGISSLRYNEEGELVASVSVPIRKVQAVYGVVTAEIGGIQALVDEARTAVLPFFILALIAAFLSSLLLTATIAQPIRQLAIAADRVREGIAVAGRVRIPDFTRRRDEIGELSGSLREMTHAIYKRIEDIESFAADVSHELKNPLTSIRSAAETLAIAKTPEAQEKLMAVIQKDVIRMDRLITDISNASRLDAELARETREPIEIKKLLQDIVDLYATTRKDHQSEVRFLVSKNMPDAYVLGSPSALGQVFRNLIDNAISFNPSEKDVRILLEVEVPEGKKEAKRDNRKDKGEREDIWLRIRVEDSGPGIPKDNLESIFKRFYTERPSGTDFGNNSGLGLAISRQITESHSGQVWAENMYIPDTQTPKGAVFHIRLPARRVL